MREGQVCSGLGMSRRRPCQWCCSWRRLGYTAAGEVRLNYAATLPYPLHACCVVGELVRAAACQVVEATARSGLRATKKQLFSLLESLNEHLRQPHESVQLAAANALREFLFRHFNCSATLTSAETERVRQLTVGKYIKCLSEDGNVAATRGSAMGLGSLNEALLLSATGVMDDVLAALVRASDRRTLIAGEADAATRCRAVDALIDIAERVRRMTYPTLPLHSTPCTLHVPMNAGLGAKRWSP